MSIDLAPSNDLGLQHVLERGLALIRGQSVDELRRDESLDGLIEIFSEADRGSQAVRVQNLMFAIEEQPAFERFALFFRYLKDSIGADLPDRLSEAVIVLTALRSGREPDQSQKSNVADLFEKFLDALEQEIALIPLATPREIHYG